MAEVTGDFGGTPIQLNNAATEATLKQLVQAIGILAAKQGKDVKSQAALEKELKKFQQQLDKAGKSTAKTIKSQDDEIKKRDALNASVDEATAKQERAAKVTELGIKSVRGLANAAENTITKMTGLMSQMASMGNSFSSAASMFNSLPLVGGLVGGAFSAIAASGDKVFNSFKQSAAVGANFNGSMREMVNSASSAGLTMDQFSGIIAKNGEALALMGGSTTAGAMQLAKMGRIIRTSPIGDDLARLGFSTEDISNGMARFGGMMAKSGKQMDATALAKTSAEYLKNLDAVSRLTGISKDALQAETDARMADAQYRLMLAKLDPEGAKNLELMMSSIPKEHQAGLKEIMATGTATSEEAIAAMAFMAKTGQSAMALGEQMRTTGTLTKEQAIAFDKSRQSEMKTMAEEAKGRGGVINTIGNFGDAVQQKLVVGVLDSAARTKDLGQVMSEQAKEQQDAAKKQKDSMDPAAMQKFQQDIAEMSNKMTMLLAQHMPMLMSAFETLSKFINDYAVPIFQTVMDNFKEIVAGIAIVKGSLIAFSVAAKANEIKKSLAGTRGHTRITPMYVEDVGGGGGFDRNKRGRGGRGGKAGGLTKAATGAATATNAATATKAATGAADAASGASKAGTAMKALKGAGALGAVVSVGMLGSELSNISEQEKKGELTKEAAKEKKGEAIGETGGGLVGAAAGAKAGAVLGTMAGPIGTIVGGLVGGIGGGLLGMWGGKKAGGAVAATPKGAATNQTDAETARLARGAPPPAPTPVEPVALDYSSPEASLKTFAMQQRSNLVKGEVKSPKTGAVDAARQTMVADAETKKQAEALKQAKLAEAEAKLAKDTEVGKIMSTDAQSSEESAAKALNTTMMELLRVTKENNRIAEKQLSAQESLGGDLFLNAAA
jgi:hypothetical protein